MPFLSSLFSCCAAPSRSDKTDAETRHARIVAVTQPSVISRPHPPPHDNGNNDVDDESPPNYRDIGNYPLITLDEKVPIASDRRNEVQTQVAPALASNRSSIISIPSTRLTELTSLRTGDTTTTQAHIRHSMERVSTRGSRPPSYYSEPRRSPSPDPGTAAPSHAENQADVWRHPVMADNWLEVLRTNVQRGPGS